MTTEDTRPHYEFSEKYDSEHARRYFEKHNSGFWRRLSNWREIDMARKALVIAGRPRSVLDLPCGTGRFWPLLAEEPERRIYAADNSRDMLDVGMDLRPPAVTARIEKAFQCSAFASGLPDNFVFEPGDANQYSVVRATLQHQFFTPFMDELFQMGPDLPAIVNAFCIVKNEPWD